MRQRTLRRGCSSAVPGRAQARLDGRGEVGVLRLGGAGGGDQYGRRRYHWYHLDLGLIEVGALGGGGGGVVQRQCSRLYSLWGAVGGAVGGAVDAAPRCALPAAPLDAARAAGKRAVAESAASAKFVLSGHPAAHVALSNASAASTSPRVVASKTPMCLCLPSTLNSALH